MAPAGHAGPHADDEATYAWLRPYRRPRAAGHDGEVKGDERILQLRQGVGPARVDHGPNELGHRPGQGEIRRLRDGGPVRVPPAGPLVPCLVQAGEDARPGVEPPG